MNDRQLRYVQVLAQEGSFSRAAEILNISQPSLSQYLKKIEKEIGLDLFERMNGDVRLTDAGQVYIQMGRQILDLQHQMEVAFSDLSAHKIGTLTIGTAPYRAAGMMPPIARAFRDLYPGMHLVIREGTTAEIEEEMEHGAYDLAVTLLPLPSKLFEWERVCEEELILAVPASYPALEAVRMENRKYPAVLADALSGRDMVMLTETQYMQRQLQQFLETHQVSVKRAVTVKSLEAQIEMVKSGVGLAMVPSGIEKFVSRQEAVFYSFVPMLPRREVVVMWRRGRKLPQTAQDLVRLICSMKW